VAGSYKHTLPCAKKIREFLDQLNVYHFLVKHNTLFYRMIRNLSQISLQIYHNITVRRKDIQSARLSKSHRLKVKPSQRSCCSFIPLHYHYFSTQSPSILILVPLPHLGMTLRIPLLQQSCSFIRNRSQIIISTTPLLSN
jgi:hypothetical protein